MSIPDPSDNDINMPFLPRDGDTNHDELNPNPKSKSTARRLIITLFVMVLIVEMGMAMTGGPITRISESIVCRHFYTHEDPSKIGADGEVDEELCKIGEVQCELAVVKGYMELFDGVLCAVLAIPYGLLADRKGRKWTLLLSIPAFTLNAVIILCVLRFPEIFPLRAVWLSCLPWLSGGGPVVAFAIIWTMMADVTSEEERAVIFFRFGVASMAADFVSSAISSWLMSFDPWVPLLIGFAVCFGGVFFAMALPETIHLSSSAGDRVVELSRLSDEGKEGGHDYASDTEDTRGPIFKASKRPMSTLRAYITPYAFILQNRQILLLLTAFVVYRLSRGSSWFLVQYISTRYNWTIAQANLLNSLKPLLTILVFLLLLPYLSRTLRARRWSSTRTDLLLARASIIALVVGTAGIGLSGRIALLIPSLMAQSCGMGFVYLTRSLISTFVPDHQTARLFTVIEILQALGSVIASLVITNVFRVGVEMGGGWIGLAWYVTSALFALVGAAVWGVRVPDGGYT